MQHLYTESLQYGLERQKTLRGEQRHELASLSDGRRTGASELLHRAASWLVDQLAALGQNLPCVDNELACDVQLVG
jgi:hypothetical protein